MHRQVMITSAPLARILSNPHIIYNEDSLHPAAASRRPASQGPGDVMTRPQDRSGADRQVGEVLPFKFKPSRSGLPIGNSGPVHTWLRFKSVLSSKMPIVEITKVGSSVGAVSL